MNMQNPMQMMKLLKSDGGVEELMKEPVYENEHGSYSQAELLADVINILRMDAKRLGAMHGVDISIEKIEPERIAWVLGEMVQGNTDPMVQLFNGIEDLHHEIMADALDADAFQSYLDFKESQLYTLQPDEGATPTDTAAASDEQGEDGFTHPSEQAGYDVPADMTLAEFERQIEEIEESDEFADLDDAEEVPSDE